MPRRSAPSVSLVARVRAWFGLRQAELARFLIVSPALVQHIESGQRALTSEVTLALLPLLPHLPPGISAPPANLPPGTTAPESAELDFRRRVCLQQAARCRTEMATLAQQAHVVQRWAQALPALLPAAAATRWHLLAARATALEAEAAALAAVLGAA